MSEQPAGNTESAIVLDAEPTGQYQQGVRVQHARTRNLIALILIWALVLSLPIHLAATAIVAARYKEIEVQLDKVFDRWLSLIGPLAGTAVGAYYVGSKKGE